MYNIMEILDKLQFFGGQRAGRKLWADKPADVQDADIEAFSRNVEMIREYIQQLESLVPRWISVEERLPEKGDVVLAMWHGEMEFARYAPHRLGWYNLATRYDSPNAVTHWMPLPEPPKEE